MPELLQVKNLRVSFHTYAGEVQAVRGVDFLLNKGETLAMVGESGCGKTVTAKSIMRLMPVPPGEIKPGSALFFAGRDIVKMDEKELGSLRGGDISMIFQDPMTSLNPTMQIGKQIAESLIIHRGMGRREASAEAVNMLKLVDIPNPEKRVKEYPHQFSGGMRQRAMIAIALACNPKILIADEPTTALDVTIQAQILDLMEELQNRFGTAILLITHDLGIVASIANRIQVMYSGIIVERGACADLFNHPQHPYTWALLRSALRLDDGNKQELYSISGTPPDLLAPPPGCPFAARCEYCMPICGEVLPEETTVDAAHTVRCWLQHPAAPVVESPYESGGK